MNKYATEIKWGLIFTAATLLWMVFEKMMGWHGEKIDMHPTYTNLFALVAIVLYVLALLEKRRKLGGAMNWIEGFTSGAIITVVVAILSPLAQWITHKFISPEYFSNAIRYSVESELATQEQAETFFNLSSYMMQSAVAALIMGLVTSAVVALILRKK